MDDGNLQVSRDGGESWTNLAGRFPGLPADSSVSRVVASSAERGRVYATFDRHQRDDFALPTFTFPRTREVAGGRLPAIYRRWVGSTFWPSIREMLVWASAPPGVAGSRGPLVPPGTYAVELSSGGRTLETRAVVEADPLHFVTADEARARYEFLLTLNCLREATAGAIAGAEKARKELEAFGETLGKDGENAELATLAREASVAIQRIHAALAGRPGRAGGEGEPARPSLRSLAGGLFVELDGDTVRPGSLAPPTAVQRRRLDELRGDLEEQLGELNQLFEGKIADLNRKANQEGLPRIRVEKVMLPSPPTP
jgi:hypothetical protein